MIIDPEQIAAVITEIAESQIMARFGELAPDEVREKSSKTDLVTVVDEATEKELAKALRGIYPAAEVIGEEGVAASPGADRALDGDGAFWIVDPLDGTRNFVRGKREFGTIVALAVNGETRMGWIYGAPDGLSVVAEKGSGVSINNEKLASPTPAAENSQKPVGMKSAYWLKDEWRNRIPQNLDDKFAVKAGHCSAYSYIKLIRGDVDFKLSSRIHAWDHAAGALMVSELKGRVAFLDTNEDYRPMASADRPLLATARGDEFADIAFGLTGSSG